MKQVRGREGQESGAKKGRAFRWIAPSVQQGRAGGGGQGQGGAPEQPPGEGRRGFPLAEGAEARTQPGQAQGDRCQQQRAGHRRSRAEAFGPGQDHGVPPGCRSFSQGLRKNIQASPRSSRPLPAPSRGRPGRRSARSPSTGPVSPGTVAARTV